MDVEIDPNEGGDCFIYQLSDDRFFLVAWVSKSGLAQTQAAIATLHAGEETVLGEINCGARVWIAREDSGYLIAIGDTDSKDLCYRITQADLDTLLDAEPG